MCAKGAEGYYMWLFTNRKHSPEPVCLITLFITEAGIMQHLLRLLEHSVASPEVRFNLLMPVAHHNLGLSMLLAYCGNILLN